MWVRGSLGDTREWGMRLCLRPLRSAAAPTSGASSSAQSIALQQQPYRVPHHIHTESFNTRSSLSGRNAASGRSWSPPRRPPPPLQLLGARGDVD